MTIAFQPNAFQSSYPGNPAFQGFERAVSITFFGITQYPSIPRIQVGSLIPLIAYVVDPGVTPPIRFNPTSITVRIYNSLGVLDSSLAMNNTGTIGEFRSLFQSTVNDLLGPWMVDIIATNGSSQSITEKAVAFVLVSN